MSLIPGRGREKQVELYEFEANLIYIVPRKTGILRKILSQNSKTKQKLNEIFKKNI